MNDSWITFSYTVLNYWLLFPMPFLSTDTHCLWSQQKISCFLFCWFFFGFALLPCIMNIYVLSNREPVRVYRRICKFMLDETCNYHSTPYIALLNMIQLTENLKVTAPVLWADVIPTLQDPLIVTIHLLFCIR